MKTLFYLLSTFLFLLSCSGRNEKGTVIEAATVEQNGIKTGIKIGERAPELVFESPSGEKISLSSLRGKMVLIDFWAAWCSPCRLENPNLVKTYHHFKDKEFQNGGWIYGLRSLPGPEKRGLGGAIEKDKLVWESHVSDLKGWQSVPAAQYGVMAIPANFLIDGNGIIVAKGLRGEYLTIN